MRVEHSLRPREFTDGRIHVEVNLQEIDPARAEIREIREARRRSAAEPWFTSEALRTEVREVVLRDERLARAAGRRDIVIAWAHAVRDVRVVEDRHRVVRVDPLRRLIRVVHDVAVVRHVADIKRGAIGDDPIGLRGEDLGVRTRIVLRVGKADHTERGSPNRVASGNAAHVVIGSFENGKTRLLFANRIWADAVIVWKRCGNSGRGAKRDGRNESAARARKREMHERKTNR